MNNQTDIPSLASLEFISYLDENGLLPEQFQGKVGVYAIFDAEKLLQFVGYSRDVYTSLKQHLVRQSQACYWVKVQTIDRPSRTILENIQKSWISDNGAMPSGNSVDEAKWTQAINVKPLMTDEEQANYQKAAGDELTQAKLLKNVARRIEAGILAELKNRGLQAEIRFNPKLKDSGLLDLKS
jgi:hypothetical protein